MAYHKALGIACICILLTLFLTGTLRMLLFNEEELEVIEPRPVRHAAFDKERA